MGLTYHQLDDALFHIGCLKELLKNANRAQVIKLAAELPTLDELEYGGFFLQARKQEHQRKIKNYAGVK
jgi:hypothetical protein